MEIGIHLGVSGASRRGGVTIVETITNAGDDGWETSGNVWSSTGLGGNNLTYVGSYFGSLFASFHFDSIPLGRNQVITSAIFAPYVVGSSGTAKLARIRAQLVADAAKPDNVDNKPSDMTDDFTTAGTPLDNTALNLTGVQSWDVTAIVQEIVNQGSWVSGNAMNLIIENNGSVDTNNAQIAMIDHANSNGSPLTIVG